MRTKDLHLYQLGMSQLCYYYTNPHNYKVFTLKYILHSMLLIYRIYIDSEARNTNNYY